MDHATLLRYGIRPDLELRLETDGFARSSFDDNGITVRQSGFSDTSLGLKWQQREGDEKSGSPGIAWLFHVDLDSGSAAFRAPGKVPSLRGVAEWALPDDASFGVMPGIVYDLDEQGRRNWNGILAASASHQGSEVRRVCA